MNALDIAVKGFLMPLYALVDGILAYVVSAVYAAFQNTSQTINGSSGASGLPVYAVFPLCFAIMGLMMKASGYLDDVSSYAGTASYGLNYPKRAIIYALGAVIGLAFFWSAISGVTLGGIGSDALFSSIASIVILVVAAVYSLTR